MPAPTKTNLTGIISTVQGPLPSGTLKVRLAFDTMIPGVGQIAANPVITFTLDSSGGLSGAYLWSTALMESGIGPAYYTVTAFDSRGQIAFGPVQVTVPNVSVYDVSNWL